MFESSLMVYWSFWKAAFLHPCSHSSCNADPTSFNSHKAHDSTSMWLNQSQPVSIDTVSCNKKGVSSLRASAEATWITAPEVCSEAVNINDSYHPSPGLIFVSFLQRKKGSAQSKHIYFCWEVSLGGQLCSGFKNDLIPADYVFSSVL